MVRTTITLDNLDEKYSIKNTVDVVTSLKHSSGAFKNKLTFSFNGTKEKGCSYTTAQENATTTTFSNGIGARLKVKSGTVQAQADFPRRNLPQGASVNPYLVFDLDRATFTGTPSVGALFFFRNLKWHVLSQLASGNLTFKDRAEYIFRQDKLKLHLSSVSGYNFSNKSWVPHRHQLTATFDKVEGTVRVDQTKESEKFAVETVSVGAAYADPNLADFTARLKFNPQNFKEGAKDLHFGIAKRFAPNLAVKARYSWFNSVGSYYANFKAHNNLTVSGTIELSHLADKPTKGCCDYPFNFGFELAFNA